MNTRAHTHSLEVLEVTGGSWSCLVFAQWRGIMPILGALEGKAKIFDSGSIAPVLQCSMEDWRQHAKISCFWKLQDCSSDLQDLQDLQGSYGLEVEDVPRWVELAEANRTAPIAIVPMEILV